MILAMYSSLQRIDIVATREDGRPLLVQTDHRDEDEVDNTLEISTIFALTRLLLPKRSSHAHGVVRYVSMGTLHPELMKVIASCDGEAEAEGAQVDLSDVTREAPQDLADRAFSALGKKVLEREGLPTNEQGLRALCESVLGRANEDEDEIGYWTHVVELAAATGEVVRALHGGRWVDDPDRFSDIPFLLRLGTDDGSMLNLVGKSVKFFHHGEPESPVYLLRAAEDTQLTAGPLLLGLKPSHWGIAGEMACEPLAGHLANSGVDVPLVVYGHDRPNTFALFRKDAEKAHDLAALREEALKNLASIHVEINQVELPSLTFHVVHGSFFAGEKILDEAFMRAMHTRLGVELVAAAIPEKGRLLLTSAVASMETMSAFMAIAKNTYEKNDGGRQVSPTVFLVSEGRIVGVAKVEAPPPKKGLLARLFGSN